MELDRHVVQRQEAVGWGVRAPAPVLVENVSARDAEQKRLTN
jgi:hypothetical protein